MIADHVPLQMLVWPLRGSFLCGTMAMIYGVGPVFIFLEEHNLFAEPFQMPGCQLCPLEWPHVHPDIDHFEPVGTKWVADEYRPMYKRPGSWQTRQTN